MKKRNERFTTEVGTAQWPHLNSPDTKFDKDGIYHVALRLTKEHAETLISKMETVVSEFVSSGRAKSKKMSAMPVKDQMFCHSRHMISTLAAFWGKVIISPFSTSWGP